MIPCPVCAIPLSRAFRETCPSTGCPCFGTVAGSVEMESRADQYRNRPSRFMSGDNAYAALERDAQLAYLAAVGAVQLEHYA